MRETRGREAYHHGALPEALVAAAFEVLDEQGQEKVSVREVARRAGVSAGAPFRHFADRQALLTALADRVLADFVRWQEAQVAAAGPDAGPDGGSVMRAIGLGFVRYAVRHPRRFELVRSRVFAASREPELRDRLDGIDRAFTDLIVADQEAGRLRPGDPALVGLAGQALVYGLAQMIVDGYLPAEKAEQVAAQVLDTFGQGIANQPVR
ncbi:TetR/AcrR family transcriptional regulator [Kitasatospora sp. NPDC086791]|uniref:TetR/AcrR family transcriptional regulator n=1 Tax=Kitasatospora sp. NPDC086791 TaxID=3155178 RepID=UPI003441BB8F